MPKYRILKKTHELARLQKIIEQVKKLEEDPELKESQYCRSCLWQIEAHAEMIIGHIKSKVWRIKYGRKGGKSYF